MIIVYKPIPEKILISEAKKTIPKLNKWFKDNPDRKDCNAETWYGKMFKFTRGNVKEEMSRAVAQALGKPTTWQMDRAGFKAVTGRKSKKSLTTKSVHGKIVS